MDRISTAGLLKALGGRGRQSRIVALLQLRCGEVVKAAELVDFAWGDCEDGGPLNVDRHLVLTIHKLRAFGFQIYSQLGGYRLLKIETGIPIPPIHRRDADAEFDIISELQVGQSILHPAETDREFARAGQKMRAMARRVGIAITTRRTQAGLRCWRVS